jgi:hypothetical protein
MLASAPGAGIQPDANLASSIEQAFARHAAVTSEPFQDAGTGHPVVAMAVPVDGGQPGSILVAVVALDSPTMLEPLTQAVQIGHTGHAGLLDPQGRIQIPQNYRERAGLVKDVEIVSMMTYFEVWDTERWAHSQRDNAGTLDDLRARLAAKGV